jgi:uroporphyrinogen-III synthase
MSKTLKVLITRPQEQASALAEKLNALGFKADILGLTEISTIEAEISTPVAPLVIFVSANAVRQGLPQLRAAGVDLSACSLNAIGPATAGALAAEGLISETPAAGFRSEELLAHLGKELSEHKEASIICGVGGRGYLKDSLEKQGLKVNRIEVYKRHPAKALKLEFEKYRSDNLPDIISLMNGEAVTTLNDLIEDFKLLEWKAVPVVVSSSRIQKIAKDSGFLTVFCQTDPTESSLIDFLSQFSQR